MKLLTIEESDAALSRASVLDEPQARADRHNYGAMSSEDFEVLLYAIYKNRAGPKVHYDTVRLMNIGADKGRDIWLTRDEIPTGLVQCKRVKGGYSAPAALREIVKFLLFAETEPSLLPDPRRFCFTLAVSADPSEQTTDLFDTPKSWLAAHEALLHTCLAAVRAKGAAFAGLDLDAVLPRIRGRLDMLTYELLKPRDLDGLLEPLTDVRQRFFKTHVVIDRDATEDMRRTVAAIVSKFESVGLGLHPPCASPSVEPVQPETMRVAALPIGPRSPAPVNVLMALGASRFPAIAFTLGIDAEFLQQRLQAVESIVAGLPPPGLAPRAWAIADRPEWPQAASGGGRGLVWRLEGKRPDFDEIVRALAGAFHRARPSCGDALVIALPGEASVLAGELAEIMARSGRPPAEDDPAEAIPIHIWADPEMSQPPADPLISRLRRLLEGEGAEDRSEAVRNAFAMRRYVGVFPTHLARRLDEETIRLHDLSLLGSDAAARPGNLEEERAAALISETSDNRNLLRAVAFLPVSAVVIDALAKAPDLTRAVAGLLTGEEMQSPRPPWSVPMADHYRPACAGRYRPAHQEIGS